MPVQVALASFDDHRKDVSQALMAFSTDVTYAVSMARAAVTIERKRSAGQNRRKDKQASL